MEINILNRLVIVTMKSWLILILTCILLLSGCIEKINAKVPVVYVNVSMGEDANGTMVIQGVEAYAGELPKLDAPKEQLAGNFPAVYVNIVQDMFPRAYLTGKDYVGPGVYSYIVGFDTKLNTSEPMGVRVEAINSKGETIDLKAMRFNWSSTIQSKTYK
ncbi:Uncharacterised protein [uncultured archaeon]|nr:Uncharacterised protein [uncultured archaeon]